MRLSQHFTPGFGFKHGETTLPDGENRTGGIVPPGVEGAVRDIVGGAAEDRDDGNLEHVFPLVTSILCMGA